MTARRCVPMTTSAAGTNSSPGRCSRFSAGGGGQVSDRPPGPPRPGGPAWDLERAGIVERKPVPGDRRAHAVELTERGLEVFDRAHIAALPIAERLTSHLGP